jgi:deoxyribodipyrimidine photolyase-related protein
MRHLILVLGDQLDHHSQVFQGFDPGQDAVWMAEVQEEAAYVWSHKLRLAYFFATMRHFREELLAQGFPVHYHELMPDPTSERCKTFSQVLQQDIRRLQPQKLILVRPGDYRVLTALQQTAAALDLPLEIRPDNHFLCSVAEFQDHAAGKKNLLQENFYRHMRRSRRILLDLQGKPLGGLWNYDKFNRQTFGRHGPPEIPPALPFPPDTLTQEVITLVNQRFPHHPGSLDHFTLPVTAAQAEDFLLDFIEHRLPYFGDYEDAMWMAQPFLYHSRFSAPLNLKLLNPRRCLETALVAYEEMKAPLPSVEGFVRQVLGWREYIRGLYWLHMPGYQNLNYFNHQLELPAFYWDGDTEMNCFRQTMKFILAHGYSHHIHRLMVVGLFALLFGVHPKKFHDWHLAMYVDAIDWVSLPNTLGMSQFGDGGIVGSKPYCASGNYIHRMSNFCSHCTFKPDKSVDADACPFTTLYWDFLDRHYARLKKNVRLAYQLHGLENKMSQPDQMSVIRRQAADLKKAFA